MGSRSTACSISVLSFLALVGLAAGFMLSKIGGGMDAVAGDARLKTFTCSGELWNVWTDPAGTSWLEIGHGIYQCSIRDTSSENAKRILSVCNLKANCSLKIDVDTQRLRKSTADGECDDLCIFESDKIVWVKKGKAQ
jgi:hypothetical protein